MESKVWIVTKIILKIICCIFGFLIIINAVTQYFAADASMPEDEKMGMLIGGVTSGLFSCGIWLFYYGTIVALKKAGVEVASGIKDPSFWEVVSAKKITYSDGSTEIRSEIRGSFFGLLIMFFVIFGLVQTYYLIMAPILGPITIVRDFKALANDGYYE